MSLSHEQEALDLIRKYVGDGQFDANAQQQAAQPEAPQEAAPQGQQAMDFAGEQPQTPMQVEQPPTAQQQQPMQFPQQSTANSTLNAYHQNLANADQQYNQGMQQQQDALKQKAAVEMQNNDAVSEQLQGQAQIDQQYQGVRNGLDEHLANITQRSVSQMEQDIGRQEQMLNENPHDFWGSSSTVGKIAGIIGIIGAGAAGKDTSQYLQNIVNNRVAEAQRKQQVLSHLQRSRQSLLNNQQQMHTDAVANLDAQKAAAYKYLANQMEQRKQLTANAQVQANLDTEIGKMRVLAADHTTKGADDLVKNDLNGVRTRLQEEDQAFDHANFGVTEGRRAAAQNDDIVKQTTGALARDKTLPILDKRIHALGPALKLLEDNPHASNQQIDQIMLQILNGEVGGRVPAGLLEHMTPQAYVQKLQEARAKLTNNPQDAEAQQFLRRTADIARQTLHQLKKERQQIHDEILQPWAPRMDDQLRGNLHYGEQVPDEQLPEPTNQQRAQQILQKYNSNG